MTAAVMLDSGPLGLVTQRRRKSREADECREWMEELLANGTRVYVPEIADYELRRELLRAGKVSGIERLDRLHEVARYVPLTTQTMLRAAVLWAQARNAGLPTAAPEALDADVILAAQALTLGVSGLLVATANPSHLRRFVAAEAWRDITA